MNIKRTKPTDLKQKCRSEVLVVLQASDHKDKDISKTKTTAQKICQILHSKDIYLKVDCLIIIMIDLSDKLIFVGNFPQTKLSAQI